MKKLIIIALLLMAVCIDAAAYKEGVSKELAASRLQNISNVKYDLTFEIPDNVNQKVAGTIIIECSLNRKSEVVLDFQGRFSGACIINGKKRVAKMENGHIVIPKKLVKQGTNRIEMNFVSLDSALTRQSDYLSARFEPGQAQTCFPCFDQPDMGALFTTQLKMPEGWKMFINKEEKPVATTFYSFMAGLFDEQTAQHGNYSIRVFHRGLSPEKVEQLPAVIDETVQSLEWIEGYTGVRHPYNELGMVILPDTPVGSIEHLGIMQLSDYQLFFNGTPSQDERQKRTEQIVHETAGQWFGNMVSFKWPEDAWTKEAFASFMAHKFSRRKFSKTDYAIDFLSTYLNRAFTFDRTEGTHPIAQTLQNLDDVKLLNDDIMYAKVPVMMYNLEDILGAQALQEGFQKYLSDYYLKTATWDDFIDILDNLSPFAGIRQFNDVWVKEKGMPTIHTTYKDGQLTITQADPYGRDIFWRQKFEVRLIYDLDPSRTITVDMTQPTVSFKINRPPSCIIPNYGGHGYGRFTLDNDYIQRLPLRLIVTRNDQSRYALLQTLHDNYLMGNIPASYFGELYRNMVKESNPLLMQATVDHMFKIAFDRDYSSRQTLEQCIMDVLPENKRADCRQIIIRKMMANATSPDILARIQRIWDTQNDPLFDEHDYMEMAYRLALTYPGQWQMIINKQRGRLKNAQLREEFDYVSRACTPDEQAQRELYNTISNPGNRPHESWALHTLRLLNADIREPQSNVYIPASLNSLEALQESGSATFVSDWLEALLQNHKSLDARQSVENYLNEHPTYPEHFRNKIFAASWLLRNSKYSESAKPVVPTKSTNNSSKKK